MYDLRTENARPAGFGLLDAMLGLVLIVGAGAAAYYLYGQSVETNRSDATLEQFNAVRAAVKSIYGTDNTRMAAASTTAIAASGLVPGTASGNSIINPYGNPVTITGGDATGDSGYTVNMGSVSVPTCMKMLHGMTQDTDITAISFGTTSGSVTFSGANAQLTDDAITTHCTVAEAVSVSATIEGSGAAVFAFSGAPSVGPMVVGPTTFTNPTSTPVMVPSTTFFGMTPSTSNGPAPMVTVAADPSNAQQIIGTLANAAAAMTTTVPADGSPQDNVFTMSATVASNDGLPFTGIALGSGPTFSPDCVDCTQTVTITIGNANATDWTTSNAYYEYTQTYSNNPNLASPPQTAWIDSYEYAPWGNGPVPANEVAALGLALPSTANVTVTVENNIGGGNDYYQNNGLPLPTPNPGSSISFSSNPTFTLTTQ